MTYFLAFALFIFSTAAFSNSYCFKNRTQRDLARSKVSDFLLPSESAQVVEENCLYINLKNPHREELIVHILKPFSPTQGLGSEPTTKRTCSFELIETKNSISEKQEARLPIKTKLRESQELAESSQTMRLEGLEQRGISLGLDDNRVDLICHPRGKRAEIVLRYKSETGPSVSTSLELAVGEEREIGSMIEDLKRDSQDLGTEKGVRLSRETKKAQSKILLKFLAIF